MELRRLAIRRLPGIDESFEIESAGAGIHVVFGPNGIGKSSICRAIESLYWNDRGPSQKISVSGEFESDGASWWVEREGPHVRWQRGGEDSSPPKLPGSHNHRCFFLYLRDLIDLSQDSTHDIGSEIRRQMSGGFDMGQVMADCLPTIRRNHGRSAKSAFDQATTDVHQAEGEQSRIQRRADEIDDLRAQLEEVESSARRLESVRRAAGLSRRLEELTNIKQEIATLPKSLARLSGDEAERIKDLQSEVDEFDRRARTSEEKCSNARKRKHASRLSTPLDLAELSIWQTKAKELNRVESDLRIAEVDHGACRDALAAALSALGGGNVDEIKLDVGANSQLFEFLTAAEKHKNEKAVIEARLRLLENIEQSDEGNQKKLQDAIYELRRWLREPDVGASSNGTQSRRPWLFVAGALAVLGIGLGIFVDIIFLFLAAVAVGIIIPVLAPGKIRKTSGTRENAQNAFVQLGVQEPDTWDVSSATSRLRNLEDEAADIAAKLMRARDRDVERRSFQSDLEGLSKEESILGDRREKLSKDLGLEEIRSDVELVDYTRALDEYRSTSIQNKKAAGKVKDLEQQYRQLLSDLADVLERHDEPKPKDAIAAEGYLVSLQDRNAKLTEAMSAERQAMTEIEQIMADRTKALDSIKKIYSKAALEDSDLPGLMALLGLLERYHDLKNNITRLEGQNELDKSELFKVGEIDLAEYDQLALERLEHDLSQKADEIGDLRDEIADISAQANEAKRGNSIQDLIAEREKARAELENRRNEALFFEAGRFLIETVEEEYEQTQMPYVFERARSHFYEFTEHGYELRLSKDTNAPRLFAVESRSGEGRELDELSDGTRAHLLLAARIAFAEEVEQGNTLPLFLDEALDQSDPERFEAIVKSLGRIAEDKKRQVFYLTSDPLDVERIRQALSEDGNDIATTLDLGLIRTQAASVSAPHMLEITPKSAVPEPGGHSPGKYGAILNVPAFAPANGFARQHFFYLLSDNLNMLHSFLEAGIQWVGQWKTVSSTSLAENLSSNFMTAQEISFRVDLLEAFCELWQQGKGRPVDRDVLEQSNALSPRYREDVVLIAHELGGDPGKLLSVIDASRGARLKPSASNRQTTEVDADFEANKDSRLKGFRAKNRELLEKYFRDHGYLDDQPVLSENDLKLRAFATPAAGELSREVASDCLGRWWTWASRMSGD